MLVEDVTELEDLGASMASAIEIEEDFPEPYINAFQPSAVQNLRHVVAQMWQHQTLDVQSLNWLFTGLTNHLQDTEDDDHAWKRHYLQEEAEFFVELGVVLYRLMSTDGILDITLDVNNAQAHKVAYDLIAAILTLCRRVLPLVPDAIKATLSRRDSVQTPSRDQPQGSLVYVLLAATMCSLRGIPPSVEQFMLYDHRGVFKQIMDDAAHFFCR